ncbi:MAG TPA: efflux RND transporter periplasmic adaptor subunit, partial [Gemmatimonadales bacterium]|nr:efflux RND transporter periplasmic adaptor subunit [Gemmatimonadales bacterium]
SAARDLLARTRVVSPISGRVQDILVQPGERVEAGRALAQVIAGDTLDLIAAVPAASLGRLKPGQTAEVLEEGDPTPHPAWVAGLAPGVDSLTGAGAAVVRVPNPDGALRVGAGAEARVRIGVRRDALLVPDSALVLRGDSSVVFVVGADSIAHAHPVGRGARSRGRTEVTGDLRPGDRVVTTGAFGLEDGMGVAPTGGAAR